MKRFVLVRDDDVNFYSDPALLDRLYRPLFERGLPVNFSVIPEVAADTPIGQGGKSILACEFGLRHEPFIPPNRRGRSECRQVSDNRQLVSFVRRRPVEVLQHGATHEWDHGAEFDSPDEAALERKIERGREILGNAFGRPPVFFCPPWDRISRQGLRALKRAGFLGVSGWHFGRNLPLNAWPAWFANRYFLRGQWLRWGDFLLVEHPGYFVGLLRSPAESLDLFRRAYERCSVLVIVTHHWEFNFDGKPEPDPERLEAWYEMIDTVIRGPETLVVTFRELYDHLRAN